MPAFLSVENLLDIPGTSVSATSEIGGLGVQSVLTEPVGDIWRFTGTLDVTDPLVPKTFSRVDIAFPTAQTVKFFAIASPRTGQLPIPGSESRTTASNVAQTNSEVYNGPWETWEQPRGYRIWYYPTPITARYWCLRQRFNVLQPYGQIGRIWLGTGLETKVGMAGSGNSFGLSDTSYEAPRRASRINLPVLSETEADSIEDMMLKAGTQKQIFFIGDTSRLSRMSMFGKFTSLDTATPLEYWGDDDRPLYSINLSVKEDK